MDLNVLRQIVLFLKQQAANGQTCRCQQGAGNADIGKAEPDGHVMPQSAPPPIPTLYKPDKSSWPTSVASEANVNTLETMPKLNDDDGHAPK